MRLQHLSAAEFYAKKKSKKYKSTCEIRGLNYIPVCGETTGGWTDAAHKIFDDDLFDFLSGRSVLSRFELF